MILACERVCELSETRGIFQHFDLSREFSNGAKVCAIMIATARCALAFCRESIRTGHDIAESPQCHQSLVTGNICHVVCSGLNEKRSAPGRLHLIYRIHLLCVDFANYLVLQL